MYIYIYMCDTWVFTVYQWYINPGWIPSAFQGHRGCQEIALEKAGAQPELGMALSISSEGFLFGQGGKAWEIPATNMGMFIHLRIVFCPKNRSGSQ